MIKQYAIVTDLSRCLGCHTCAIGCIMENELPPGVAWLSVRTIGGPTMDTPSGKYPRVSMHYFPVQCMHCRKPPCIDVCSSAAIFKRDDGVVLIENEKCNGCQDCIEACPYEAIRFDPATNSVSKCTLCNHRIDRVSTPYCVTACPGRARVFGDINDPHSEVAKLIAKKHALILPENGIEPSFHYVVS